MADKDKPNKLSGLNLTMPDEVAEEAEVVEQPRGGRTSLSGLNLTGATAEEKPESVVDQDYKDLGYMDALIQGAANAPGLAWQGAEEAGQFAGAGVDELVGTNFVDDTRQGQIVEGVKNAPGAIVDAVKRDPVGVAEGVADTAGSIGSTLAGAGAGASVLSAVPIVGTAVGAVVGGGLGYLGWDSMVMGLKNAFGGEPVTREDVAQSFGETGEILGSGGLGAVANKTVKTAGRVGGWAANELVDSAKARSIKRSPPESLRKAFLIKERGFDPDALDEASETIFEDVYHRINARESAQERIAQGELFQTIKEEIGKPSFNNSAPGLINEYGRDVAEAVRASKAKFTIEKTKSMLREAQEENLAKFSDKRIIGEDKRAINKALEPFKTKARENLDARGVPGFSKVDSVKMERRRQRLSGLDKQIRKAYVGNRPMTPDELKSLELRRDKLKAQVDKYDLQISNEKLSAEDFADATRTATQQVKWATDPSGKPEEILLRSFRAKSKEAIAAGFPEGSPELEFYRSSNKKYKAAHVLREAADESINYELGAVDLPNAVRTGMQKFRRAFGGDIGPEVKAITYFRNGQRALRDGITNKPGPFENFARFIGSTVPRYTNKAFGQSSERFRPIVIERPADFFTPQNAIALRKTLAATEEFINRNPEEIERDTEDFAEGITSFYEALSEVAQAVEFGIGKTQPEMKMILSQLAGNPATKAFTPIEESRGGIMDGVSTIAGEPLTQADRDRYFQNLKREGMNSYDISERREFLHRNRKFMTEPQVPENESDQIDYREVERRAAVYEAEKKFKSSTDVADHSSMSKLLADQKKNDFGSLRLVSSTGEEEVNDKFWRAYKTTRKTEGGFSDRKSDRGGLTMYGVTQETYTNWLKGQGRKDKKVTSITPKEVEEIYSGYWEETNADELPYPLDMVVFDAAINSGSPRVVDQLQKVVGARQVGGVGPETLRKIEEMGAVEAAKAFLDERLKFYESLAKNSPSQRDFIRGWRNRIKKMRRIVDGAVKDMVA